MEIKDKYILHFCDDCSIYCYDDIYYNLITTEYKYPIYGVSQYNSRYTYSLEEMIKFYPNFNNILREKNLENKYEGFRCLYPNPNDMKEILNSKNYSSEFLFETYKAKRIYCFLPDKQEEETNFIYEIFTDKIYHEDFLMDYLNYNDIINISPDVIVNNPNNCFLCF